MKQNKNKKISQSAEDYLEAILNLSTRKERVLSVDLANCLGYTRASVSRATKKLVNKGLLEENRRAGLRLTEEGFHCATEISNKHQALVQFWVYMLGIDQKTAEIEACAIEHVLSNATINRIKQFMLIAYKSKLERAAISS